MGDGVAGVSESPFQRIDDEVRVALPAQAREVLRRSLALVAEIVAAGREETWRLAPPLYDDPLLEAEASLTRAEEQGASGLAATQQLLEQWSAKIATATLLDVAQADELARALNLARLVLIEAARESPDRGLVDLYGWLLESLVAVVTDG